MSVKQGILSTGKTVAVQGLVRYPDSDLRSWWSTATVARVVRHGVNGRYQRPYQQQGYRCTPTVAPRSTRFVCLRRAADTTTSAQLRFTARYHTATRSQPPLGSTPPVGIDWGNTCTVNLTNEDAEIYLETTSSTNWNTDHWDTSPSNKLWNGIDTHYWKDAGGADRGCGDSVTLTAGAEVNNGNNQDLFSVTISETDPWTGKNSYSCTITPDQAPAGAYACNVGTGSTTTGDELTLNYQIVSTS